MSLAQTFIETPAPVAPAQHRWRGVVAIVSAGFIPSGVERAFVRVESASEQGEGRSCESVPYRTEAFVESAASDGRLVVSADDLVARENWCVRLRVAGPGTSTPVGSFGPPVYIG